MDAQRRGPDVVVRFSYAEAMVLDALLHRWQRDRVLDSPPCDDQADQRVLWDLTAGFEPIIAEAFNADEYARAIDRSRADVRDYKEPPPDPE